MSGQDQPRASTSKEGNDRPTSLATTAYYEDTPIHPISHIESRSLVAGLLPSGGDNTPAYLAKLQTYLPTGTWVTYTALQTWAFSLRSTSPPTSPTSNCNAHQRIALVIVLGLSAFMAFLTSFIKNFVYDKNGKHVIFPPPDLFTVVHQVTDPITGIRFPCKTKEKRYCWPFTNDVGELVYDEKKTRLRVLVFKRGIKMHVRRKVWFRRVWHSWFHRKEEIPNAPRLITSPPSKHMRTSLAYDRDFAIEIDQILATAPALQPRWKHTLTGAHGSKSYLDLRPSVWAHALVSTATFLSLALLSTQVCDCLYPSIPDYLPSTLQTGLLALLSFVAALFLRDDAVSMGQTASRRFHEEGHDSERTVEVPIHLRAVVEMLVWVQRP
ncbi:hypothetical protein K439DRAFT_1630712 [Ramaria rubella]|nr:hypothetical protein K439DRAFT_1630712 [Ramaria rubella]